MSLLIKVVGTSQEQNTFMIKACKIVKIQINLIRSKVELATLKSGDILEILLDNGEPIENVPGSIKAEGHDVLDVKQIEEYWQVSIRKG
jgi:sulfite reductase (ferredoxin)